MKLFYILLTGLSFAMAMEKSRKNPFCFFDQGASNKTKERLGITEEVESFFNTHREVPDHKKTLVVVMDSEFIEKNVVFYRNYKKNVLQSHIGPQIVPSEDYVEGHGVSVASVCLQLYPSIPLVSWTRSAKTEENIKDFITLQKEERQNINSPFSLKHAKIINMSFGNERKTKQDALSFEDDVDLIKKGNVIVCSLGNKGVDFSKQNRDFVIAINESIKKLSAEERLRIIFVGGLNIEGKVEKSFNHFSEEPKEGYDSFFQSCVIYAPGKNVPVSGKEGFWKESGGTSFAAPFVSSLIARLCNLGLTLNEARSCIFEGSKCPKEDYKHYLNIEKIVKIAKTYIEVKNFNSINKKENNGFQEETLFDSLKDINEKKRTSEELISFIENKARDKKKIKEILHSNPFYSHTQIYHWAIDTYNDLLDFVSYNPMSWWYADHTERDGSLFCTKFILKIQETLRKSIQNFMQEEVKEEQKKEMSEIKKTWKNEERDKKSRQEDLDLFETLLNLGQFDEAKKILKSLSYDGSKGTYKGFSGRYLFEEETNELRNDLENYKKTWKNLERDAEARKTDLSLFEEILNSKDPEKIEKAKKLLESLKYDGSKGRYKSFNPNK